MHVTILTSCKHAVIIQCHVHTQDCNCHFNGTADILNSGSSLLSTDTYVYYKIKIQKTPKYNLTYTYQDIFTVYNCNVSPSQHLQQFRKISFLFANFTKNLRPRWWQNIFVTKAWSLSFERILVKNTRICKKSPLNN